MTLEISKNRLAAAGRCGGRRGGFTLIEVIVVVAIIVALFGLVAGSWSRHQQNARRKATKALIAKLQQYIDNYKSFTGHYPPDGLDSVVKNDEGETLKGSAALYHALTTKITVQETTGGRTRPKTHDPIAKFLGVEVEEDPDTGVYEIVDGWGNGIHYDNTENGKFSPQTGSVHYPPIDDEDHPPDPREGDVEVDGVNAVKKPGIQSKGFDLWSHGARGHEEADEENLPVATWNLNDED